MEHDVKPTAEAELVAATSPMLLDGTDKIFVFLPVEKERRRMPKPRWA